MLLQQQYFPIRLLFSPSLPSILNLCLAVATAAAAANTVSHVVINAVGVERQRVLASQLLLPKYHSHSHSRYSLLYQHA